MSASELSASARARMSIAFVRGLGGIALCGAVACTAGSVEPNRGAPSDDDSRRSGQSDGAQPSESARKPTSKDMETLAGSAQGAKGGATQGASPGGSREAMATDVAQRYGELPDGHGGINFEQVSYTDSLDFDTSASLSAFERELYPLLRENCAECHSTDGKSQAPLHADSDVELAHDYALTRVSFRHPEDSKLVVRMAIDGHNCFGRGCTDAAARMLAAVKAWSAAVVASLPAIPRPVAEGTTVSEEQVAQWIASDRKALEANDREFFQYASLHELHNAGVSAERLNVARAALSKALNSTARWAPTIVNPVDVNEKGLVYRFDIRDYWGYNKGVKELIFGGTDDDIFFGDKTNLLRHRFGFTATVSKDPEFARKVWARVREGSKDAYQQQGNAANTVGFKTDYVEVSQLVYTLSRPDVYNAIMAIPVYAPELEKELGVVKDSGAESYQYVVVKEAITIDSRMAFRARRRDGGFYWKTFDIFTGNQQVFPFWEHPLPKFVSAAGATPADVSLVASLLQPVNEAASADCKPSGGGQFTLCTNYTGEGGVQQSASEIIWDLPNGLQGYAIYGGLNQRRVDAFSFIVLDPRRLRAGSNGTGARVAFRDVRLHQGGSCMGCHADGMNRMDNDLRDWLDDGALDASWVGDAEVEAQVRKLYAPSSVTRSVIEEDRRPFFEAMALIRNGMLLGQDKNLHVEPIVWAFEWAQSHYSYASTTSN